MSNVLIEFTQATEKRAKGERVWVDEGSARSLVKIKKHARVVTEKELAAEARRAAAGLPPEDADEGESSDEAGDGDTAQSETSAPAGGAS